MSLRVLTIGSFTTVPVHEDHEDLFRFCSSLSGEWGDVIVGVNSDQIIFNSKGFWPKEDCQVRAQLIEKRFADEVFVNHDLTVTDYVFSKYRPDIYVIGWDWNKDAIVKQTGLTAERLNKWDCVLAFAPTLNRIHSSDLRK